MKRVSEKAFTLVEILVVAPIVILAIGAFLTVIITMTGEVIASRASNALTFSVQDTLARIEEDVKLSSSFLASNSVALNASDGQGLNNDATNFTNASVSNGSALILNMTATTGNPLSTTSQYVYLKDQPNPCATAAQNNIPLSYNVVYFVKDDALWRRTIMPQQYADITNYACTTAWQQPSCNPDWMVQQAGPLFCATEDIQLVTGIGSADFSVNYYANSSSSPIALASDPSATLQNRSNALVSATTLDITLSVEQSAGGRVIAQTADIQATRLDTNASSIATVTPASTPATPITTSFNAPGARVTLSWPVVAGATGYTLEYNINGGAWLPGITNQNIRTYTVNAPFNQDTVNFRVQAINSAGSSAFATRTVVTPLWEPLILQNGWRNYTAADFSAAGFTKTRAGAVILKGLISKASAAATEALAYLPEGYRPSDLLLFGISTNPNAAGRVDIYANGTILLNSGDAGWVSLETVRFIAAGTYTQTTPTPVNGWSAYAAPWGGPRHMLDTEGRVWVQGLLNMGTNTDNTLIFSMPTGRVAGLYQHIASRSSGFGGLGLGGGSGGIVTKGSGSSYLAVNAMYYPGTDGTWTNLTLQNGWVAYNSGFSTPQYTKGTDNLVSLKGLIRSGTSTASTALTTLPAGFRPRERILYTTISNQAHARVDIQTNGVVSIQSGSNAWYSLDGIHFIAEQ